MPPWHGNVTTTEGFDVSFDVRLYQLLTKKSNRRQFKTAWRLCDVIVIVNSPYGMCSNKQPNEIRQPRANNTVYVCICSISH